MYYYQCCTGGGVPWSNWLRHVYGPSRPVRNHTFTEYRRGVTASAVGSMSESSGGPLHHLSPPSIRYPIPTQEAIDVLVAPLEMRVSVGGGDHLTLCEFSAHNPPPRLTLPQSFCLRSKGLGPQPLHRLLTAVVFSAMTTFAIVGSMCFPRHGALWFHSA
ncbi:hypothetical protein EVAR_88100_1 [Eumeta japonica]|uniref:Uncharacterized protein n=1 Tax=Eumeta variegata TaxID=151549 RepID=A0A4C1WJF7_EUMVA|nr:hypothetical protein EVAR_88100_1 [Eumeta japonica]